MTNSAPTPAENQQFRRLCALLGVLGALAILAVYWPGLSGGFLFDDFPNLVNADGWKITTLDLHSILQALGSDISGSIGRPLSMLSFGINHWLGGMNPYWMKLTNVLIHITNTLIVFLLVFQLIAETGFQGNNPGRTKQPYFVAFSAAAAWALHPLQLSTVLYVVQRMELLAQFSVLASLLCYIVARRHQLVGKRAARWLFGTITFATAGLGFKESALLTPVFILLTEACVFRFAQHGSSRLSRPWLSLHAALAGCMLLIYLFFVLPKYLSPTAYANRDFDLAERLWTQLPVLKMYLSQILLPAPDRLLFHYDQFPISHGLFDKPPTWGSGILLSGLVTFAAICWKRRPLIALGIGWFFVAHLLTSNIVPLEIAFEHRNYLALLGVIIALIPLLGSIGSRFNPDARRSIIMAVLCCLAFVTWLEAKTWGDPLELAITHTGRNPDSPRANYQLGKELVAHANGDTTSVQWQMAIAQFETAAALPHADLLPDQALILLTAQAGRPIPESVWDNLRHKATDRVLSAQDYGALHAINACRISNKCIFDDSQWMRTLTLLLEKHPNSALLHVYYGNWAFNALGDYALGINMMREATRLAPHNMAYKSGLLKFLLASTLHDESSDEVAMLAEQLSEANAHGIHDAELQAARTFLGNKTKRPEGTWNTAEDSP